MTSLTSVTTPGDGVRALMPGWILVHSLKLELIHRPVGNPECALGPVPTLAFLKAPREMAENIKENGVAQDNHNGISRVIYAMKLGIMLGSTASRHD